MHQRVEGRVVAGGHVAHPAPEEARFYRERAGPECVFSEERRRLARFARAPFASVDPRTRAHRGLNGDMTMSNRFDLARVVAEAEPGSEGFAHALNLLVLAIRRTNPAVGPLLDEFTSMHAD